MENELVAIELMMKNTVSLKNFLCETLLPSYGTSMTRGSSATKKMKKLFWCVFHVQ